MGDVPYYLAQYSSPVCASTTVSPLGGIFLTYARVGVSKFSQSRDWCALVHHIASQAIFLVVHKDESVCIRCQIYLGLLLFPLQAPAELHFSAAGNCHFHSTWPFQADSCALSPNRCPWEMCRTTWRSTLLRSARPRQSLLWGFSQFSLVRPLVVVPLDEPRYGVLRTDS